MHQDSYSLQLSSTIVFFYKIYYVFNRDTKISNSCEDKGINITYIYSIYIYFKRFLFLCPCSLKRDIVSNNGPTSRGGHPHIMPVNTSTCQCDVRNFKKIFLLGDQAKVWHNFMSYFKKEVSLKGVFSPPENVLPDARKCRQEWLVSLLSALLLLI